MFVPAGAGAVIYTAPVDQVVIVKSLRLVAVAGVDVVVSLGLGDGSPEHRYLSEATVRAGRIVLDASWNILEPGETLYALADVASSCTLWISGAVL